MRRKESQVSAACQVLIKSSNSQYLLLGGLLGSSVCLSGSLHLVHNGRLLFLRIVPEVKMSHSSETCSLLVRGAWRGTLGIIAVENYLHLEAFMCQENRELLEANC